MLIHTWMPLMAPKSVQKETANHQVARRGLMPLVCLSPRAGCDGRAANGVAGAANRRRHGFPWRRRRAACLSAMLVPARAMALISESGRVARMRSENAGGVFP